MGLKRRQRREEGHRMTWTDYHSLDDIYSFFDYLAERYKGEKWKLFSFLPIVQSTGQGYLFAYYFISFFLFTILYANNTSRFLAVNIIRYWRSRW